MNPKDLTEDGLCPDHLKKPEVVSEENYFFKLTKYKDAIAKYIKENPDFIIPQFRANEVLNQLEDIQDISVSRSKDNVQWAIDVLDDSEPVSYTHLSNSFILLTVPDTIPEPVMQSVKFVKMENPTRAYFDIDSSVLTVPRQDWTFTSNGLKKVIVSQFSTNPDKVRVVMYFDDDYDLSKIHFYRIKNNIIIQMKDTICKNDYFQNTFRDDHASARCV